MIDLPVHTVNHSPAPTGTVGGFEVSAANVARWGGDRQRYLASLATGLAVEPGLDPGQVRDLAGVAAWRSGVIGLRADALRAIRALGGRPSVGAVLGLPAEHVAGFVERQATDRFFWPLWRTDYVFLIARVGGFVGLGGPWLAPPQSVTALAPGRWHVRSDGSTWNVDVDLFGHAITAEDLPLERSNERVTATLRTRPTSYLLDLVREPS